MHLWRFKGSERHSGIPGQSGYGVSKTVKLTPQHLSKQTNSRRNYLILDRLGIIRFMYRK